MLPLVFRKATLVEENQQFYPKTYCDFVIRMTLEALMCVYTPWPPPPTTTPTTHTHTHLQPWSSVLSKLTFRPFLAWSWQPCEGRLFFFFASIFGRGSDKQHGGILKCQLKMKINNLGEGGVRDTVNITHILPRTDSARPRGQRGDWQVRRLDLAAAGRFLRLNDGSFGSWFENRGVNNDKV